MRASLCICACCAVLRSIRDQLGRGSLIERSTPTHLPQKQAHTNVVIIIIIIIIVVAMVIMVTFHLIIVVMVTLNNQAPHTSHSQVVITVTFFSKDEHDRWKYVVNGFWRQAHPPCHTWMKHKTAQQARLLKHPPYYCIFIWVFFPLYFVFFFCFVFFVFVFVF